jgi:Asp-tRNA(Asn)/Glu-tRNA(Gln) amidotransferase A subunit family amidase
MGVAELSRGLAAGTFSSEDITRELLAGLAERDRFGAFLAITPEDVALAEARRADALRHAGQAGPHVGQNPVALAAPYMMEKLAPAKLECKLVAEL